MTGILTSGGVASKGMINHSTRSQEVALRITDPLSDPDWNTTVLRYPNATPFHTSNWARVLNKTYGHKAFGLTFVKGDQIVAVLPIMEVNSLITGRRGVAMPFSDFCLPLRFTSFGCDLLVQNLLNFARERKWRYFEVRGGRADLPPAATSCERYYGHELDLTQGLDKMFAGFKSRVRGAIRKAEKGGLVAEVATGRKAMLDFFKLQARTRRRHGIPPQPLSFFLRIYEEIIKPGLGFMLVAKMAGEPVAAAIFFHFGRVAIYKFAASDSRNREFNGNNLIMWKAIKHLVKNGLKRLHFGRTPIENEGLRQFKLSWGTKEEIMEYFRFAVSAQRWECDHKGGSGLHNQVFGRLPLAVNRLAGALIYPHLD